MESPIVSVIIPVGPAHTRYASQAVASVRGQTVRGCEIIIVDDSGVDWEPPATDRFLTTGGERGPAVARNLGIQAARAPFVLFLDADDYLLPGGVEALLRGYAASDAGYVYGDVYTTIEHIPTPNIGRSPDYDQGLFASYNLHVVTALVPTAAASAVGGFDEAVDGFEDWTLFLRLAVAGICGRRIPIMTMVYRTGLGERASTHAKDARRLMDQILSRYQNDKGVIEMAGCCGGDAALQGIAARAVADMPIPDARIEGVENATRIEFIGENRGSITYRSPHTGRAYKLGNNAMHRYADVAPEDLGWLLSIVEAQVVPPIAPFVPPPATEQAIAPASDAPTALKPSRGRKVPAAEQAQQVGV